MVNYLRLREEADADDFEAKIRDLPQARAADYLSRWGSTYWLSLQPLREVYLRPALGNGLGPQGNIASVRLLAAIGLYSQCLSPTCCSSAGSMASPTG